MERFIQTVIRDKEELLAKLRDGEYVALTEKAGDMIAEAIKAGNKVILAGNGGSAADAQHFAGEMVGRFMHERISLPAMSLSVDPCVVTCIANDFGYDSVFARQIEGLGKPGDVFVGISTSGNSVSVANAMERARERKMKVVGLLGKQGGIMRELCDYALVVPSDCTPRIQEIHMMTVHILCELIEKRLFLS